MFGLSSCEGCVEKVGHFLKRTFHTVVFMGSWKQGARGLLGDIKDELEELGRVVGFWNIEGWEVVRVSIGQCACWRDRPLAVGCGCDGLRPENLKSGGVEDRVSLGV